MSYVLCVGPNPALQRTLWFDRLRPGEVNRAGRRAVSGGGKGTNVARILGQLGYSAKLLAFVGGNIGRELAAVMRKEGIDVEAVETPVSTRVCVTLIEEESAAQTEIVEEAGHIPVRFVEEMLVKYDGLLEGADFVVLSGTCPPGVPNDFYARLVETSRRRDCPAIVDAPGELLLRGVAARPFLAKPNAKELLAAVGGGVSLYDAVRQLAEAGAEAVLVTSGPSPAYLLSEGNLFEVVPPSVRPVNAIGSGDAVAAGTAFATLQGFELREAVRFGIACGTANALTPLAGHVDPADVERLFPLVKIRQIDEPGAEGIL